MGRQWVFVLITVVLLGAGRARADVFGDIPSDVLDDLTHAPRVPTTDADGRGRAADPIAVPTPSAARAGVVALGGLFAWRAVTSRRLVRR